jgi:hypothetical protein
LEDFKKNLRLLSIKPKNAGKNLHTKRFSEDRKKMKEQNGSEKKKKERIAKKEKSVKKAKTAISKK